MIRIFLSVLLCLVTLSGAVSAQSNAAAVSELRRAMDAVRTEDWQQRRSFRNATVRAIYDWHRLRAGQGAMAEYTDFVRTRDDWPGLPLLTQRGERTIARSASARSVLTYFDHQLPRTAIGSLRYADALKAQGQRAEAAAEAARAWTTFPMSVDVQTAFEGRHGPALRDLMTERLDMLLWRQRFTEAQRLFDRVPQAWVALAQARIALVRNTSDVNQKVAQVPASLAMHPGLAYERFIWRAARGLDDGAVQMALAAKDNLGRPEAWGNRRRSLARALMRQGEFTKAYQLAAAHGLTEGGHYADLEWLAGFIALRKLNRPGPALQHFKNHDGAVLSPISKGRSGYWIGRAYEALGDQTAARASYAQGARWDTSFYGQLAAEKIGAGPTPALLGQSTYPAWRQAPFLQDEVVYAALLLQAAGELDLAERFLVHRSETLDEVGMGQIVDMALALNEPHIALRVAKYAASRGIVLYNGYYPLHPMTELTLPAAMPLALSIARRESEFDPKVVSPANAQGLMQLLPGTAKLMAARTGRPYSAERLLGDPNYNAQLGSAYLDELSEEFGQNLILVASGYNAGPGRPRRWIELFGDPRSRRVDAIDWIEGIPFRETRNYVMRVMEAVPIYEMRLSGRLHPWDHTTALKRR